MERKIIVLLVSLFIIIELSILFTNKPISVKMEFPKSDTVLVYSLDTTGKFKLEKKIKALEKEIKEDNIYQESLRKNLQKCIDSK